MQIARVAGIPIQIHWTFLLLLAWAVYAGGQSEGGIAPLALARIGISVVALFACVVLHELGHALMARHYGIKTRNILLLPIGGLAMLESLPKKPMQEFWVAFAGPLVNILLAVLFLPLLLLLPDGFLEQVMAQWLNPRGNVFIRTSASFWHYFIVGLIFLNGVVALFNLIPAFPMDGGRILRALLSIRLSRLRATRIATLLGQAFGLFVVLASTLQFNWLMVFVGLFIYITAQREYRSVSDQDLLTQHLVGAAMRPLPLRLYERDSLQYAAQSLREHKESHALVFDQWQTYKGIVSLAQLDNMGSAPPDTPIGASLQRTSQGLLVGETLASAITCLQEEEVPALPVFDRERIVGLLDGKALDMFMKAQR